MAVKNNFTGLIAENLTRAHLFTMGMPVAEPQPDLGCDLWVNCAARIQVKGGYVYRREGSDALSFISNKPFSSDVVDFVVCWNLTDNYAYVIPVEHVAGCDHVDMQLTEKDRWRAFKHAWHLIWDACGMVEAPPVVEECEGPLLVGMDALEEPHGS